MIRKHIYKLTESDIRKVITESVNQILRENRWNGNGEHYPGLIPPSQIPPRAYHVSNKANRNSIMRQGLIATIGDEYEDWWNYEGPNGEQPDGDELPECVFLTVNPKAWYDNLDEPENYDIWEIDMNKLNKSMIFLDPDRSMARKGSIIYIGDISTEALRLVQG
jgi:hypothetical protein